MADTHEYRIEERGNWSFLVRDGIVVSSWGMFDTLAEVSAYIEKATAANRRAAKRRTDG